MKYAVQIIYFALFLLFWSMYLITNKIKRRRFYRINHKIDSKIKLNTKFSVFYSLYFIEVLILYYIFFNNVILIIKITEMYIVATIVHNLFFLAFPVYIERPEISDKGFFNKLTLLYYKIDEPFNTFPSMHISMITIAFLSLYFFWYKTYALLLLPFYFLTAISTFYIKQHYFVDAVSGFLLGLIIFIVLR